MEKFTETYLASQAPDKTGERYNALNFGLIRKSEILDGSNYKVDQTSNASDAHSKLKVWCKSERIKTGPA